MYSGKKSKSHFLSFLEFAGSYYLTTVKAVEPLKSFSGSDKQFREILSSPWQNPLDYWRAEQR